MLLFINCIDIDIISESEPILMFRHPRKQLHKIGVPRGILRHVVMLILKKGPLSGVEIMDEIESFTDWRPSPGSVYPLLAHLQEERLIEPYPDEDPSFKSFSLTEKGKNILELNKNDKHLRKGYKSIRKIYWRLYKEMPEEIYNVFSELVEKIEKNYSTSKGKPDKIYNARDTIFGKEKIYSKLTRGYRIIIREFLVTPSGYSAPSPPWGLISEIDPKMKQRCCQAQKYWEVNSYEITSIAKKFNLMSDIFDLMAWIPSSLIVTASL